MSTRSYSQVMKEGKVLKEFGLKLKEIRTSKGISQEELAHIVGFDRTYISLIERGKRNPSLTTVYNLADGLKIRIKELL